MQTINYPALEANVAAWQADWIEHVREQFGDDYAEETRKELEAEPWKALQWFVEDMRRA